MANFVENVLENIYAPQLKKLPEYGLLLFDYLQARYATLIPTIQNEPDHQLINQVIAARQQNQLAWKDIYTFDRILTDKITDIGEIKNKILALRAQFHNIAGQKEYDAYWAAKPPNLSTENDLSALRQDCKYLLDEFYLRYTLNSAREHMRNNLLKIAVALALVAILLGVFFTNFVLRNGILTAGVVMFAGIVGALISIQQRIQSAPTEGDPIYSFSMLTHGRFGIFLSPISGAIFSIVLFLMFTGHLISGTLFPNIVTARQTVTQEAQHPLVSSTPTPNTSPTLAASANSSASVKISPAASISPTQITAASSVQPSPTATPIASVTAAVSPTPVAASGPVVFYEILQNTGPEKGTDFALLLIWSFIAGFAERFVPDALNRLVARSEAQKNT